MRAVIIEPASEPISLVRAKQHLRVDSADEDALIIDFITAARQYAESYIDRAIATQTRDLTLDAFCNSLRTEPIQSIISVKYLDQNHVEQVVDSTNYHVNALAGVVQAINAWPSAANISGAITVRYEAGMASIPLSIAQAILMLVAHWYEQREASMRSVSREVEFSVHALLAPYRWTLGIS
jgi:uncharacterized phiE125 gp8 family phage protein